MESTPSVASLGVHPHNPFQRSKCRKSEVGRRPEPQGLAAKLLVESTLSIGDGSTSVSVSHPEGHVKWWHSQATPSLRRVHRVAPRHRPACMGAKVPSSTMLLQVVGPRVRIGKIDGSILEWDSILAGTIGFRIPSPARSALFVTLVSTWCQAKLCCGDTRACCVPRSMSKAIRADLGW